MGDRNCIEIKYQMWNKETEKRDKWSSVFFYGHWSGSIMPNILQEALRRKERWSDESYLARIIFCELIGGDVESSTGFGIAPYEMENEYQLITVIPSKQLVAIGDFECTFEEYCTLSKNKLFAIYNVD